MNERINDLMNEAMPTIDWTARHGVELDNGERMKWYADWFDRFAELIVQECIDTILDSSVEYATRPQIANEIKQHFGVGMSTEDKKALIKDLLGVKNEIN